MSEARPKFLCDAVAAVNDNKLFITVFQVNDGIEFSSGRGETKHGSPRRQWTPDTSADCRNLGTIRTAGRFYP